MNRRDSTVWVTDHACHHEYHRANCCQVGGGTAKTAQSSASRTAPTASTATGASAAASSPGERTVGTAAAAASQTGEPLQRACYKEGGECLERQDVTLLMSRGPLEDEKRM